jgi:predicted DNA-binding protein YlxM (UPF0122 family)
LSTQEILVSDVVYRTDLYPRIETSATTVQKYAEDLSVLPPIEVNQHRELIDGWHRWTAHKKCNAEKIQAIVTQTDSDAHLLELAIERNATHGLQLSQEDKRDMARRIYHATAERDRDAKKKQLAKILSVSDRTVRDWLSRVDKDAKEARDKRIFELWLSCRSMEEIANDTGVTKETVSEVCQKLANLPESDKPAASHLTDFTTPLYNVWKQHEITTGESAYLVMTFAISAYGFSAFTAVTSARGLAGQGVRLTSLIWPARMRRTAPLTASRILKPTLKPFAAPAFSRD